VNRRSITRDRAEFYNDSLLNARRALLDIIQILGPNKFDCPNCCEGCNVEMHEALQIAKDAIY